MSNEHELYNETSSCAVHSHVDIPYLVPRFDSAERLHSK